MLKIYVWRCFYQQDIQDFPKDIYFTFYIQIQ